jgi:hypothetical protein
MSVPWAQVSPVLISIFSQVAVDAALAQATGWKPEFENRDRTMIAPGIGFALTLKIAAIVGYGNDEIRLEYAPSTNDIIQNICGLRKMTVQVKVECEQNTDDLWAFSVIERVRTRLNAEEITTQLLAVNLAIIDILDGRDVSFKGNDGRMVSAAVLPVVFSIAVNDTGMPHKGWIQKIQLSSQLAGLTKQITNVQLPP